MTFNSSSYYLFLPLVFLTFYALRDRFRWALLLLASYGFYGALKAPWLLLVLGLITIISYSYALKLSRCRSDQSRQKIFWLGTGACVTLLVGIKCLPFVTAGMTGTTTASLVTIGVSYYTFQAISYLTDVYLEIEDPEPHLGYYALYLAFFPKLLQGPIERAGDLLPQLKQPYRFDYDALRAGLLLFGWGLFKKVVIANRLAVTVDKVFNDAQAYSGLPLILATYMFAVQIYFDFSGYTDMALGAARLFNINLTQNFNSPYAATSIADFWRRWHISFSRWILDYLFKPLQMSWRDMKTAGTAAALLVTFLVSGLWHGLSWGFVVWGLLHGVYLVSSTYYRPYQKKLHHALGLHKAPFLRAWQIFVTFNLVSFAWIYFRANSIADANHIVSTALSFDRQSLITLANLIFTRDMAVLVTFMVIPVAVTAMRGRVRIFEQPVWVRWGLYHMLACSIIVFGQSSENFIYFRF